MAIFSPLAIDAPAARILRRMADWLVRSELDYHLLRATMVLIFLLFGYQKWFEYEAKVLVPFISNGPLIFWLYPLFGVRGASWFLGVSEWTFGLLLGFWDVRIGVPGALGSRRYLHRDCIHHSIHAGRLG